jgi:hypothetical protein
VIAVVSQCRYPPFLYSSPFEETFQNFTKKFSKFPVA